MEGTQGDNFILGTVGLEEINLCNKHSTEHGPSRTSAERILGSDVFMDSIDTSND